MINDKNTTEVYSNEGDILITKQVTIDNAVSLYKEMSVNFYPKAFFHKMTRIREWQMAIGEKISKFLNIKSVVDFGCAGGYYLEGMYESGCRHIMGFEYAYDNVKDFISEKMKPFIQYGNVMEHIDCGKFDCSMSIEVVEHILNEKSDLMVDNLTNASNRYIIFTAAPPGQGGTGYINEQPKEFWIEKMSSRGFVLIPEVTQKLQAELNTIPFSNKYMNLIKRQITLFQKGE